VGHRKKRERENEAREEMRGNKKERKGKREKNKLVIFKPDKIWGEG
jgi:hypothetical protein